MEYRGIDLHSNSSVVTVMDDNGRGVAEPLLFFCFVDGQDVLIGASIGIAFLPEDTKDIRTLIAQADGAMYDAKRAGRNCWRFAQREGRALWVVVYQQQMAGLCC